MKKSLRFRIASFMGRIDDRTEGNSLLVPHWKKPPTRWWHMITRWHVGPVCRLCRMEIMKLPYKEGWGARMGVSRSGRILCSFCYDMEPK